MFDSVVSSADVNSAGRAGQTGRKLWEISSGGGAPEHQINLASRKPASYVNEQLSCESTLSSLSRI